MMSLSTRSSSNSIRRNSFVAIGTSTVLFLVCLFSWLPFSLAFSKSSFRNSYDEYDHLHHRSLIVGGGPAPRGKYDAIVWSGDRGMGWGCGGAMIAPDIFLTAAHCESAFQQAGGAFVGAYVLNQTLHPKTATPNNGGGTFYKLGVMLPHPNHKEADNDIMLVSLKHANVEMLYEINHRRDIPAVGDSVGLVGFGLTEEDGELSPVLKEVNVDVYDIDLCYRTFHKKMGLKVSDELHLCTGTEEGGMDSCDSDSGTPLLVGNSIIGVTNDGVGCARPNVPAYNARVSSHADWIDESLCALSDYPPSHCLNYPFTDEEMTPEQSEVVCDVSITTEAFLISLVVAFFTGVVSAWLVLNHSRRHRRSSYRKLADDDISLITAQTEQPSPALSAFSDKF
jgi:trypsin